MNSKELFTGRTIVFFRVHAAMMVAGILAPITASFLIGYNVWIPWLLGEVLVFFAVLLTLLLPNRKGEPNPEDDLNDGSRTGTRESGEIGTILKGASLKDRILASLQGLERILRYLAANIQVLLLLFMAVLSQLGNDSLLLMLLIYVPKRYHWNFAEVCC